MQLTSSLFFYFSAHEEEGQESQVNSGEAVETRPLKDRRTNFRSTRSKSESSAHSLSWENVSFLGGELRKTISKGFQWIAYPSVGKIIEKTWLICANVVVAQLILILSFVAVIFACVAGVFCTLI